MAGKKNRRSRQRYRKRKSRLHEVAAGDRVRVKRGVVDPNFPDLPLGGWAGTVKEVDRSSVPTMYLVEWSERTLESVHPVFRKRRERDGLEHEAMWLEGKDIELETGGPAPIERPTGVPRPLREHDQDDRVRAALGSTSDDPLPDVSEETLLAYHKYLEAKLSFPLRGSYSQETGPMEDTTYSIAVTGLVDPGEHDCDESYGLFCGALVSSRGRRGIDLPLGKVEVEAGDPNRQLVDDYGYWFWNHR